MIINLICNFIIDLLSLIFEELVAYHYDNRINSLYTKVNYIYIYKINLYI